MKAILGGIAAGTAIGAGLGIAMEVHTRPDPKKTPRNDGEQWLDAHRERTAGERSRDERRDERLQAAADAYVDEHPMPGGGEVRRMPATWHETYDQPAERGWHTTTLVMTGIFGGFASIFPLGVLERTGSERLSMHGARGAFAIGSLFVVPAFIGAALVTSRLLRPDSQ